MDLPGTSRARAQVAVDALRAAWPASLTLGDIDLGGALEQQLFFAYRDGREAHRGASGIWVGQAWALASSGAALAVAATPRRRRAYRDAAAFLVREAVHFEVVDLIAAQLREMGGPEVVVLLTGRAARPATRSYPSAVPLSSLMHPTFAGQFAAFEARLLSGYPRLAPVLREALGASAGRLARDVVVDELPRIALATAALRSAVLRLRPAMLAAFDEVGTWARILPAVAHASGIPSLDVPHAEAADEDAIQGAAYDRMAAYGPRAAHVLGSAGVPPERIVEVGAPRFDAIVGMAPMPPVVNPRRVIYAAQYVAGALTKDVVHASYAAALAVAGTLAPSELIVRTHPAKPPSDMLPIVRGSPAPENVTVRLESRRPLHELLPGATVMVTAWSNSVFESVLLGVPAITVVPAGVAGLVDFSADGLALHAASPDEAANIADLLRDDDYSHGFVTRARAALAGRLGPVDGHAAERVAQLIRKMVARSDSPMSSPVLPAVESTA